MQQPYSEKEVLADALTAEKTATDHYNTFANECVHENVRNAILDCLDKEHAIQQYHHSSQQVLMVPTTPKTRRNTAMYVNMMQKLQQITGQKV